MSQLSFFVSIVDTHTHTHTNTGATLSRKPNESLLLIGPQSVKFCGEQKNCKRLTIANDNVLAPSNVARAIDSFSVYLARRWSWPQNVLLEWFFVKQRLKKYTHIHSVAFEMGKASVD